ncbi:hypothetical protein [Cyclobacterium sp.]|uniref:hypothetical protein n=1 Tax=Cyclobacterium sp. TaxID=1966343 RepID=UPI0019AAA4A1|nr:hypothetical protein [Cyclobacterium sp.]MBD3630453.1 hypothetical protein [Cyclobacterium sp.]
MNPYQFLAGAAMVDTTPSLGTVINGDFITHYAQRINDPLHAKALVLTNAQTSLVLVVVDICVMGKALLDKTKDIIHQELGIPPENVLISSTHTHAAGAVEEVHMVPADLVYRNALPELIAQSVVKARENLQPAQLAFGTVQAPEHVLCRRYWMEEQYTPMNPVTGTADQIKTNPFGLEDQIKSPVNNPDPELAFLAVKSMEGQWISILGNYSLHYVGDWEPGTISADYFGIFGEALREKLQAGKEFVGMMSNGTSGDINNWNFRGKQESGFENLAKSRRIGYDLAEKVLGELGTLKWEVNPMLGSTYAEISHPRRMPSDSEIRSAKEILEKGGLEGLQPDREGWRKLYAREQLLLKGYDKKAKCPIQVLHIGQGKIGALPGEFFAETGLKIKSTIDFPYFTICLANDNIGYVPPAHELERGGYETWRCRISNLSKEAEASIRQQLVQMVKGKTGI